MVSTRNQRIQEAMATTDLMKQVFSVFQGIEKLQGGDNFKMWRLRINSAFAVLGQDELLKRKPKQDKDNKDAQQERAVAQIAMHCIKMTIPDKIMKQFTAHADDIPKLMKALEDRFNVQTSITQAYDTQHLFNVSGPVSKFDKTLDKLEEIYAKLLEQEKHPTKDIYLAAINNATPPAYRHIIGTLDAQRKFWNNYLKKDTDETKEHVDPWELINELRSAFQDYQSSHTTAQKYTNVTNGNRGRGNFRGRARGRGRGRGNYNSQSSRGTFAKDGTYLPKCFNCGKYGHISQDCKEPLKDKTKQALEKAKAHQHTHATQNTGSTSVQMVKDNINFYDHTYQDYQVNQVLMPEIEHPNKKIRLLYDASINKKEPEQTAHIEEIMDTSPVGLWSDEDPNFDFNSFLQDYKMTDEEQVNIISEVGHMNHALRGPTAIIDSGATIHGTPHRCDLVNIRNTTPIRVYMANSQAIEIKQIGDVTIGLLGRNGKLKSKIILKNVYFHPSLSFMIISQSLLCKEGFKFVYQYDDCEIYKSDGQLCGVIKAINGLYIIKNPTMQAFVHSASTQGISLYELHCRLGHSSYEYLKRIIAQLPFKINDLTEKKCEICVEANIKRQNIPKIRTSELSDSFGDKFHIDIWGPAPTQALGGIRYFLTIVDDATRWIKTLPLKTKDEAYAKYISYTTEIFTQYGIKIKVLQSDNDSVFLSKDFTNYLQSQGTIRNLTVHDTPQQNGVAERTHQTLMNGVRSVLNHSKLPQALWYEALINIQFYLNRLPKRALQMTTPYKKRFGKDFNYKEIHLFGEHCIIRLENRNKLQNKGIKGRWLSYDEESLGHRVYFNHKVHIDCNVQFIDSTESRTAGENNILPNPNLFDDKEDNSSDYTIDTDNDQDKDSVVNTPPNKQERRPTRKKQITKRARGLNYDEEINLAVYLTEFNDFYCEILGDPTSFKEAITRQDKDKWFKAMKDEIDILTKRGTWEIVTPPKEANIIGTRFVYKIKRLANGEIDKYKARLVVQGFAQKDGIDFYSDDTFAPTARLTTVRLMLAWAAYNDWEIQQIDIKSAYLYGELNEDEEIYIRPPPGKFLNIKTGQVLKLKKALYGLKQAGR